MHCLPSRLGNCSNMHSFSDCTQTYKFSRCRLPRDSSNYRYCHYIYLNLQIFTLPSFPWFHPLPLLLLHLAQVQSVLRTIASWRVNPTLHLRSFQILLYALWGNGCLDSLLSVINPPSLPPFDSTANSCFSWGAADYATLCDGARIYGTKNRIVMFN